MSKSPRAATTRLDPGTHSIDRTTPTWNESRQAWTLKWSVRLKDGRLIAGQRSQAATKAECRARARAKAAELLQAGGSSGSWKGTSSLRDYIEHVTKPAVEKAAKNANTLARYKLATKQLVGDCEGHKHKNSLSGHSIASGTRFRAMESCLHEIAQLHGAESARQARTVLSKYVVQQLIRDELLEANPLAGMSIDLKTDAKINTNRRGGGQSLDRKQWAAVIDYLLTLDPAEGEEKPRRGRWTLADAIAKRRNTIDLALLQATTGTRQSEANGVTWEKVTTDQGGNTIVEVTGKGGGVRRVPIFDPRAAEHLLARRGKGSVDSYVIGSPTDENRQWERSNCSAATRVLYNDIAAALDIPIMATEAGRSHIWRATLNTMLLSAGVPEAIRAAHFGHDAEMNRAHYTDHRDTTALVAVAARLRDAT